MSRRFLALAGLLGVAACGGGGGEDREAIVVYAAASLSPPLEEIADGFAQERGVPVRRSYASSSTLAKQIDAGAPADVYVAADPRWLEWLAARGRVKTGAAVEVAGNSLTIVAPVGRAFAFEPEAGRDLASAFDGRLALGDPDHVPAGAYAREALAAAGWWEELAPRVVPAADARAALALVERGGCAAGVVYASDAAGSDHVEIVASLPDSWHAPIVYPAVAVAGGDPRAAAFVAALRDAPGVFRRHGFRVPAEVPR